MATLLDTEEETSKMIMEDTESNPDDVKVSRRSSSLQYYTPVMMKSMDNQDPDQSLDPEFDTPLQPRSASVSSRKRLSNLFKSFSDKRDNKTGSLTRRIRKSLFKDSISSNNDDNDEASETLVVNTDLQSPVSRQDSFEENKNAPIATPERSKSSSGETLEEIKEENLEPMTSTNPCTTESSTTSSLPQSSLPMTSLTAMTRISPTPIMTTSSTLFKPVRMKTRSGQRAFSESEAQSFLTGVYLINSECNDRWR